MGVKKTKKADDPAEAMIRQMPALDRGNAAVWLLRTIGFDPTLFEFAQAKGWIVENKETGMWAGAALVEPDPNGEKGGKDVPPLDPPASVNGCPLQPAAADVPPAPAAIDDPSQFKLF